MSKPVGVLCDWDLAKEKRHPGNDVIAKDLMMSQIRLEDAHKYEDLHFLEATQPTVQHPSGVIVGADTNDTAREPRYRTGTGPFIALDILLYRQVPHHLYRHDLESFFWVLVWFATKHDPETQKLGVIRDWLQGSLQAIGESKARYLSDLPVIAEIHAQAHSSYSKLLQTWATKLASQQIQPVYSQYRNFAGRLVQRLQIAQDREDEERSTAMIAAEIQDEENAVDEEGDGATDPEDSTTEGDFDEVVEDVPESLEDVKAELLALVATRENIMTYETFMKCLGQRS